ncbi:MAG: WG repeat-containing protein [Microcoleus vaginatus WJT46-NPBG5]|jgi:hypothetical protein|nr:WG repeat-containing protein [Microcoleus vaginatus WJT46-NPBG5]
MPSTFSDIQNHWAQTAILQLADKSIISGYPNGSFRPNATITRAELAALVRKAFPNAPKIRSAVNFSDVPKSHWAFQAISTAYEMGFLSGYPEGIFKPEQPLERTQAFVSLANGLKYSAPTNSPETLKKYFEDAAQIPGYATSAIAAALQNRLIVNYPNVKQLKPLQNATRGEVAALICQALKIPNGVPVQYIAGAFEIPPQFDSVGDFTDGIAPISIGEKYSFIDKTGKLLTQPLFDSIGERSEGLQSVTLGSKVGYIDTTAKLVIQPQFDNGYPFSNGLAVVIVNDKFGYIDKTGKFVSQPQFDIASSFAKSQELAQVVLNQKSGYIDRTGKIVIPPQFDEAGVFSEGLAKVRTGTQSGFIGTTGKMVFQTTAGSFKSFSEGLAAFIVNSKVGYIDKAGKVVIEPQFDTADPYPENYDFSEGLAVIRINNKAGYIDKTGKIVIEPKFDYAYPFSQDKAQVRVEGKPAFIDKAGKYLIEPQYSLSEYELIGPFSEGLAQVLKLWEGVGYIDETGKLIIPAQFNGTGVFPGDARHVPYFKADGKFSEGLAAVEIQRKWGYIDKTGKMIIQPQYEAAGAFSEGLARVNVGGEWNDMHNFIEGGKWGYIKNPLK